MSSALAPIVRGFAGENRLLPSDLLAPNVAVDGQNVDYSRGTIRKRRGFVKTHSKAYVSGGLRFNNYPTTNNRSLVIKDQTYLDLAGDFTLEFVVKIMNDPSAWSATCYIVSKRAVNEGWMIYYVPGTNLWSFRKYNSTPTAITITIPGDLTASTHPVVGETYHFAFWRSGTTMDAQITRLSDGTIGGASSATCSGDTNNTRDVIVGASIGTTPANEIVDIIVDELRIWNDLRSTTELADCAFRELNDTEVSDANLVGYWPMNDNNLVATKDLSFNKNDAVLYQSPVGVVPSIMPNPSPNNFAIQGDGIGAVATSAYNAVYAPVLDTSQFWAIEFWARLDTAIESATDMVLVQMGSTTVAAGNNGHVFSIYITWPGSGAPPLLKYSWSTTTTKSNEVVTPATAFNPEPGVPFHVKLWRGFFNTLFLQVNGTVIDSYAHATNENGPSTLTTHGIKLLHRDSAGTQTLFALCTIDEVRLWSTFLAAGLAEMNTEYPVTNAEGLVGYWRFNAELATRDETGNSNLTLAVTADRPVYTGGLVYPAEPASNIKMIGPVAAPVRTGETDQGQTLYRRELLVATKQSFFSQQGTARTNIKNLDVAGSESLYSQVRYQGKLICCNGVGRNYVYDGTTAPVSLTLPTFSSALPTLTRNAAGTGTFPATGEYRYRFAWYNSKLGIEGLASSGETAGYETVTLLLTTDTVSVASVPASLSGYPEITHWRLYRLDPAATAYRFLATIAIGTTTYTDTGTSITSAAAQNTLRGHPDPQNICEVYNNRLFMSRGSDLIFSEADTLDFPATNVLFVDSEDGESITGLKVRDGSLIVFKKTSIYIMDGDGLTTFSLRKVQSGVGSIGPHTVVSSPQGIYFVGLDGVYLFSGGGAKLISYSHQPMFERIAHKKTHLATGVYHPSTHQYVVSCDLVTEASVDPSKPSQEAYDSPDYQSLFTHYYRCTTGVDALGTGQTISDASVAFSADTKRGTVLVQTGDWSATISALASATSDFSFGFWMKNPNQTSLQDFMALDAAVGNDIHFHVYPVSLGASPKSVLLVTADFSAGTVIFRADIKQTEWNHIAVIKNNTILTLYVNGVAVAATTLSLTQTFATIGAQAGAAHTDPNGYVDNIFWVKNVALTADQIKGIYDFEASGTSDTERVTMVYDEESGSWAQHDKTFDYLTVAEHTSGNVESLAAYNGFVGRLFGSDYDGARSDGDTKASYTKSGTLTAATGHKLTDSSANYPVVDNGYAGCAFVAIPTDATLEVQRRIILKNTATVLYLDAPLISSLTGTYYIAPIELFWESPWMDISEPGFVSKLQFIQLWVTEQASGSFTLKYKTDANETYQLLTVPTTDEFVRLELDNSGRRVKLRIEHVGATTLFEVNSYQLQHEREELVAG